MRWHEFPAVVVALAIAAAAPAPPFWEAKAPAEWSSAEIEALMTESPWAQVTTSPQGQQKAFFLASARPVREAEEQLWSREQEPPAEQDDYRTYIKSNGGLPQPKHIVLATRATPQDFGDPREIKQMEKECYLRNGKKKVLMVGYFPPTKADPYLRILFPRVAPPAGAKSLSFALYLPGTRKPFHEAEFFLKDLDYKGQPEY